MKTLTGSCHCGSVIFEVDVADKLEDPRRCDCSLCRRKGAIMAGVPLDRLRVIQGSDALTLYQWNTHVAKHWFCSRCGIYTHHQRRSNPEEYGFNVGCLDQIDVHSLGEIPMGRGSEMSVVEDS
ncbi:MAG: aldehyde-activating protein [marine bacterium B5-7]|nr:MAG: aldehyde-activating protein [marine bacterium B5-7]